MKTSFGKLMHPRTSKALLDFLTFIERLALAGLVITADAALAHAPQLIHSRVMWMVTLYVVAVGAVLITFIAAALYTNELGRMARPRLRPWVIGFAWFTGFALAMFSLSLVARFQDLQSKVTPVCRLAPDIKAGG